MSVSIGSVKDTVTYEYNKLKEDINNTGGMFIPIVAIKTVCDTTQSIFKDVNELKIVKYNTAAVTLDIIDYAGTSVGEISIAL